MLQAPSHFCGHGHIKKFWLMQTQNESQSFDSKGTAIVSSPSSRSSNRAPMKGVDVAQRGSPTRITHGFSYVDSGKHSSVSCAESLSPPNSSMIHAAYHRKSKDVVEGSNDSPARSDKNRSLSLSPVRSVPGSTEELASYHRQYQSGSSAVPAGTLASMGGNRGSDLHPAMDTLCGSHATVMLEVKSCILRSSEGDETLLGGAEAWSRRGARSGGQISSEEENVKEVSRHLEIECKAAADTVRDKAHSVEAVKRRASSCSPPLSPLALDDAGQHTLKTCTLCGTSKTPMWRSGPQGPKSLCNACGIRYKKYKSLPGQGGEGASELAMASASAASTRYFARPLKRKQDVGAMLVHETTLSTSTTPRAAAQEMGLTKPLASDMSRHQKKSKWHQLVMERERAAELLIDSPSAWKVSPGPASLKKIYGCMQPRFKNGGATSEERLKMNRVFAKDEEEAAVLLMHLSCGLAY